MKPLTSERTACTFGATPRGTAITVSSARRCARAKAALRSASVGAVWSAALEQDVRRRLQVLAAYKMPRRWLTVAALPRNQNGKLQRRLLPAAAQSALEAL